MTQAKTKTTAKKNKSAENYLQIVQTPFRLQVITPQRKETAHIIRMLLASESNDDQNESMLLEFPYFKASALELVQAPQVWYVGCGTLKDLDETRLAEIFLFMAKKAVMSLEQVQVEIPSEILQKFGASLTAVLFSTAFSVAAYPVDFLKKKPASQKIQIKKVFAVVEEKFQEDFQAAAKQNHTLAEHINGMRQVQALPGNYANPETLEQKARDLAEHYGLKIRVFQQTDLEKIGAGGILAVGKGSAIPPRMITLEYTPSQKNIPTLALVGKGVTFDTGGISLKPGGDMHEMKFDLSGAASAMHAVTAIASLKLPVKTVAVIGLAENMPDGTATKPGDVYTALNGTTVEVQNTDAEGRLILADLLTHAQNQYKPNLMFNLATLTGAIVVALGHFYAGVFSNKKEVTEILQAASERSGEPVWAMPTGRLYRDLLKSDIADYNNIGGRYGGSCSAAAFLSVFVKEETPWAHIDIAGVAYGKKSVGVYPPVAGYGIRLLVEAAKEMVKK